MTILHTVVRGTGNDVVLLHGWGLNGACWGSFADALAAGFRVHAIDLPGHGRSDWRPSCTRLDGIVAALRPHVPAGSTIIGWSLGGMVALGLARIAGAVRGRLVLIATTPKFTRDAEWPHGMPSERLAEFRAQLALDYRRTLNRFLALQVRGEERPQLVLRALKAELATGGLPEPAALAGGLETLSHSDLRASLPEISQPTLVIAGGYDRLTPPAAARYLASHLPNARLACIARAGHAPFLSHCDQALAALRGFLDEFGVHAAARAEPA